MASHESVHHEPSDIDFRAVVGFALGLLVAGVIIHLLTWLLFLYFSSRSATVRAPAASPGVQENRLPPEPRLQTNPRQDLRDFVAAEERILNSYGWVDRNSGTVRIPIAEAMKIAIARGFPARVGNENAR
jgi:hypothetical protein